MSWISLAPTVLLLAVGLAATPQELAPRGKEVSDGDREFWSFRPLTRPALPNMSAVVTHDRWVRTPIDRFVRARQESEGLAPNRVATRRTLIRRATFDLKSKTGCADRMTATLPPAFVTRFIS